MDYQRFEACNKIISHIKKDVHKIRDFSPMQKIIKKSPYCERLAKNIKANLISLYTVDEIEYVVNSLGKNTWSDVLYYLQMFDKTPKDDLEY